jgi:hypothetical protein
VEGIATLSHSSFRNMVLNYLQSLTWLRTKSILIPEGVIRMATLETLIEERLNDDCEDTGEVREAARQYFLGLVHEDLRLNEAVNLNESVDSNEAMVLGFLKGYQACLNAHES